MVDVLRGEEDIGPFVRWCSVGEEEGVPVGDASSVTVRGARGVGLGM